MEGLETLALSNPLLHNHSINFSQLSSLPYASGSGAYDLRHYLQDDDVHQGAGIHGHSSAQTASNYLNIPGAHAAAATHMQAGLI